MTPAEVTEQLNQVALSRLGCRFQLVHWSNSAAYSSIIPRCNRLSGMTGFQM